MKTFAMSKDDFLDRDDDPVGGPSGMLEVCLELHHSAMQASMRGQSEASLAMSASRWGAN